MMKTHLLLAVFASLWALDFSSPLTSTKDSQRQDVIDKMTTVPAELQASFRIIEPPAELSSYDVNKDRAITLSELSEITETDEKDASQPFHTADADGNDVLTENELEKAPWVFHVPKNVINPVKEDTEGHLIIEKVHDENE